MPTFHIDSSSNIRNRGWAIFGNNVDGTVEPGHWICFSVEDRQMTLQVAAVQNILTISGKHYTALFFNYTSKDQEDALRRLKVLEQIAEIKTYK
jgi:hypothetical protein